MPFSTYAELQAAVADNAHRTDLTPQIIDCITLAEARMNDMLVLRDMEKESQLVCVVGQNYVSLPANYISPISMWIVASMGSNVRTQMLPATPQELTYTPSSSIPRYYAIDGDNIRFDCPANDAFVLFFRFIQSSNLSNTNTTNYLLTRRPDLYLAATMVEVARYTRDQDLFNTWEPVFLRAAASFKAAESRARGQVPLRTDFSVPRRSKIFNGE